jgi:hypothetical protein
VRGGKGALLAVLCAAKKIKDELEVQLPVSQFAQLQADYYSNFSLLVNNTRWNLWPYLASLGGVTIVLPEDAAFGQAWMQLMLDLVSTTLQDKPRTMDAWLRNVAYYHVLLTFKKSNDWLVRPRRASCAATLLPLQALLAGRLRPGSKACCGLPLLVACVRPRAQGPDEGREAEAQDR